MIGEDSHRHGKTHHLIGLIQKLGDDILKNNHVCYLRTLTGTNHNIPRSWMCFKNCPGLSSLGVLNYTLSTS